MTISQKFVCKVCSKEDVHTYQAEPVCCGVSMSGKELQFPRGLGDEHTTRLHLITLNKAPVVEWQLQRQPKHIFELWRLAPGRAKGERIGWIGARETVVEWKMPTGVKIDGGFANTIEEAAGLMLEAMQGGAYARQNIQAQLVS